jgi:hypothetical protein
MLKYNFAQVKTDWYNKVGKYILKSVLGSLEFNVPKKGNFT